MDVVTNDYIVVYDFQPPSKGRLPFYQDIDIRGRSEPYQFYSHTETSIWSFSIKLVASVDQDDLGSPITIREDCDFLESLAMPDYGSDPGQLAIAVQPPHATRIWIKGNSGLSLDRQGTLRNFNAVWQLPYDIETGLPHIIGVTFDLHEEKPFGTRPDGYADVRKKISRGQDVFK